jgi:hypothetical protein
MVNHFCKNFLFPRYKFLKDGWQDVLPERPTSLYLLAKIEDSRRGGQKGYLGEGDCSVNKDEIHKLEVQPEQ